MTNVLKKLLGEDEPRKPFRAGELPGVSPEIVTPEFTGTYTLLADVSEFQMNVADAAYLAWSKAVVIRALYGANHDDKAWFGGQRRALLHSGGAKFVGIYQYLVSGQSGTTQAQAFHSLVGAIQKGEVFIADFEEGSKPMLTDWYNEMIKLYGAGISKYLWTYSGLYFGQNQGVMPVQWLADYTSAEPAKGQTLWQFTSAYNVPGVGVCDCSVYHGSVDQLAALAYQGSAPAPTPDSPGVPTNGKTTSITSTSAVLTYTGVSGGVKYDIQVTDSAGNQVWRDSVGGSSGSGVKVTGLKPSTAYKWRIAAYNAANVAGDWSGFIPFTTASDAGSWSYPAPGGVGIGQGTATVPVHWSAVSHNGTPAPSYTLLILDAAGKTFQTFGSVKGTSQVVTLPRGNYTARVWANGSPVGSKHTDLKITV